MDINKIVSNNLIEHGEVVQKINSELLSIITKVGQQLAACLENDGTIFWCGNGGSAADCQHLAAELVGRFKNNRRALRSIALTTDTSVLTCVANDFSFDEVFSRQIEAMGRKGDLLVVITTSGQSENILRAINAAKELGISTVSLLGKGGGEAKALTEQSIVIPSSSTARIQEMHILIGHILCELIEEELGVV